MIEAVSSRVAVHWARLVASRRSVILCYHGIGPSSITIDPGFLRVRPAAFRAQVELLRAAGFEFVTVGEFAERGGGFGLARGLVALSFDDGMDDNHAVVLPILRELGVTATVYVATGLIGRPNPWLAEEAGARMMTVPELRDLASAGIEIGAHTVTHPDLTELDYDGCLRELTESRRTLEVALGVEVRTFAYPFCRYGPAAISAVRAAGFAAAVTCQGLGGSSLYELRRTLVTGKDGMPTFLLKLADLHQPVMSSPPGRVVRAATRGYRTRRRGRIDARSGPVS